MTEVLESEKSKIEGGRDIKEIIQEIFRDWESAQGSGQRGPYRKRKRGGGDKVLETSGSECLQGHIQRSGSKNGFRLHNSNCFEILKELKLLWCY